MASNTTAGKGLEALRKLRHRFDPQTAGRRTNIVSSLTAPPQVKLDELRSSLEIWEENVRQFEARRGPHGEHKDLDDDLKIGAIMNMVPDNLREHLTLNQDSYGGVDQNVRMAITNYIEGRLGLKLKPPPASTKDPNAMDLRPMAKKPCSNCGKLGHDKGKC